MYSLITISTKRGLTEKGVHDKAVKDIARVRFDYKEYDTYTNPGGEKRAYVGPESDPEYPDIVVLEKGIGRRTAIVIAEVETTGSVNEKEGDQWASYSKTGIPFYLYVPVGYSVRAKTILKSAGIKVFGLRTYRYDMGKILITNISIN